MKKLLTLFILLFLAISCFSQDVILKRNGEEIQAKVLEVLPEMVKYKKFENQEGPTYSIYISEIFMITYQGGLKDIFHKQKENKPKVNVIENKKSRSKKKGKETSSFTDSRDGKEYKTIKIGDQWWMAENLNYESAQSWCYDNNPSYCEQFGKLYTYEAANNVCPEGWHLPSDEEWKELEVELGMKIGVDEEGWRGTTPGQGFKLKKGGGSGFNAELTGQRYWGVYYEINKEGYFWTNSEHIESNTKAWARILSKRASISRSKENKDLGFSVRCIKGEPEIENKPILTKKVVDKHLVNKGNKYISLGVGYGASYGGSGIKLQGKTSKRTVGLGFSLGFGKGLVGDDFIFSAGPRLYPYKGLYVSIMGVADGEGEFSYSAIVAGCEFNIHKHWNIDFALGKVTSKWYNKGTLNLGINYKF